VPYFLIENFAAGLDLRKHVVSAPAGTLLVLENAAVSPGGEIEKRRAFTKIGTNYLAGTFGLASTESTLYAFTRNTVVTPPALGVPGVNVNFQKIPNGSGTLTQYDYDSFDGKVYLVCGDSSFTGAAANPHYYDGAAVPEGNGKGYYIRTYQTKVYAVSGKFLNFSAVGNPTVWDAPTIVTAIPVTSLSNGNPARCTVAAADIGKFSNGKKVQVSGADTAHSAANGLHTISAVGTPANTFILDNVDCSGASGAQTTGVTVDNEPTAGRGFINLSLQDADSEFLTSLEVYYDKLAIFSSEATQLWSVDPDPALNQFTQLLRGTGTEAPRSTLQYGSGDILLLASSGIRSVKARDISSSASVSDIGSPIDRYIQSLRLDPLKGQAYLNRACAILEPVVGRFWMVFPNEILVLSDFPGPKITAWSVYTVPFTIDHTVVAGGRIFFRVGNDLYVYGGPDNNTFDACHVKVRLPWLDSKKPGHRKLYEALDLTITGTWTVKVNFNFNDPEAEEVLGTFTQSTWNAGRAALQGYDSHFSLRFYNDDASFALLSNAAVHYRLADDEA
jgi:hypothetical protein